MSLAATLAIRSVPREMGWVIGIIVAGFFVAWISSRMQRDDMESVIRRLPEDERRKLDRDFKKIERDEPTEGDPEYGEPGTPWGMFDGTGEDGRLRAHWIHSSEANARRQVKVGGEYLCRVGDDENWRRVWFRVLEIEECSRDELGWWTLSAVVEKLERT